MPPVTILTPAVLPGSHSHCAQLAAVPSRQTQRCSLPGRRRGHNHWMVDYWLVLYSAEYLVLSTQYSVPYVRTHPTLRALQYNTSDMLTFSYRAAARPPRHLLSLRHLPPSLPSSSSSLLLLLVVVLLDVGVAVTAAAPAAPA